MKKFFHKNPTENFICIIMFIISLKVLQCKNNNVCLFVGKSEYFIFLQVASSTGSTIWT